jgi:hypothetical protein
MACAAVFDDNNLLRSICEVGDQQFLRTARLISHCFRTVATETISVRLRVFPVKVQQKLDNFRAYNQFKTGTMNETIARNAGRVGVTANAPHSFAQYVTLYETGFSAPMVIQDESSPTVRMQRMLSFINHLRCMGVDGPYFIVSSSPTEWQPVIEMTVPDIPLVVNVGSPTDRQNKLAERCPSRDTGFIWLSSYALALKDSNLLARFFRQARTHPSFTVFDHGHIELRRGWKTSSPTYKLYMTLAAREHDAQNFVHDNYNHAFLSPAYDSSEAELRFFFERIYPGLELPATKGDFMDTVRAYGIGKRDAPLIIDNVLREILPEMLHEVVNFRVTRLGSDASPDS